MARGAATPETTTGIAVVATEPELAAASMAMPEHASAEPVAPVAAPAAVALAAVAPAAVAPTPTAPSASVAASAPAAASVAPPTPRAAVEIPPLPPGKFWLELTPEQVDALFERGALFVDARMTSQYADGHVAGAVTIPIWEAGADSKVAQLPFDVEGDMSKPIVVYCGGGDCEDSHNLGTMITQAGHLAVYVYKDGYPDWLKRGRPIRKGAQR